VVAAAAPGDTVGDIKPIMAALAEGSQVFVATVAGVMVKVGNGQDNADDFMTGAVPTIMPFIISNSGGHAIPLAPNVAIYRPMIGHVTKFASVFSPLDYSRPDFGPILGIKPSVFRPYGHCANSCIYANLCLKWAIYCEGRV